MGRCRGCDQLCREAAYRQLHRRSRRKRLINDSSCATPFAAGLHRRVPRCHRRLSTKRHSMALRQQQIPSPQLPALKNCDLILQTVTRTPARALARTRIWEPRTCLCGPYNIVLGERWSGGRRGAPLLRWLGCWTPGGVRPRQRWPMMTSSPPPAAGRERRRGLLLLASASCCCLLLRGRARPAAADSWLARDRKSETSESWQL